MDYATHYERLIARARSRQFDGYRERHHVVPRCMAGNNDRENIVELTAEEHYVAHQLLVKIHPSNRRLVHAAMLLSKRAGNNKTYGWLRRAHAKAISERLAGHEPWNRGLKASEQTRAKLRAARARRVITAETGTKISAALKGRKHSAEHRENHAAALRGRKLPPEQIEGLRKIARERCASGSFRPPADVWVGRRHSDESKAKIAEARRGKPLSEEHKNKLRAAILGTKRPAYSQAAKENIKKAAAARIGIPLSPEHRAKLREAHARRLTQDAAHG